MQKDSVGSGNARDIKMAKSYFKLPEKDIKAAVAALTDENTFVETGGYYLLHEDLELLKSYADESQNRCMPCTAMIFL